MNSEGKRKGSGSSSSATPISAVFLPLLLPLVVAVGLVAVNHASTAATTTAMTMTTPNGGRDEEQGGQSWRVRKDDDGRACHVLPVTPSSLFAY
jgi:hypothetical protein